MSSITKQTIAENIEIIVLDSASTDGSKKIASNYGAKIIHIPEESFNHGLTRNIGISEAEGNLLYYTVQDASLAEVDQLEKMSLLFSDIYLQAVTGMQAVPHEHDKNPAKWFQRYSAPSVALKHFPDDSFKDLHKKEQLTQAVEWDNVNAMYRKSALVTIPFRDTAFAEDKFWAIDALRSGFKIAFDPSLVVYHYHHHSFSYSFKVKYIINYNYYKFSNDLPAVSAFFKPTAVAVYRINKNNKISFLKKILWSLHNVSEHSAAVVSDIVFLCISKIFGERGLDKSFNIFCSAIPQGKVKG